MAEPLSPPRVSIVVVTYMSRAFIDQCLSPFDVRPDIEIVLLENASGDGVVDHVRKRFPCVKVIDNRENVGFARGNNRAFEHCTGRYILLLNPDAFVGDAAVVDRLADALDADAGIGAVGPRLINPDGSHQTGDAGWRIRLGTVVAHAMLLQRAFAGLPSLYLTNHQLLERERVELDWICGACMMVRSTVVSEVGGLDEEVFMYGEDIEWGTRIRDAGWRITYLPNITVLHLQGATQKGCAQTFVSTKWLDDAAKRYASIGTSMGYAALKVSVFAGYSIRSVLWISAGTVLGRPQWRGKGGIMWHYARHALRLPAYSKQRGQVTKSRSTSITR
jgi:GT2 family glycosyltransferase